MADLDGILVVKLEEIDEVRVQEVVKIGSLVEEDMSTQKLIDDATSKSTTLNFGHNF